MAKESLKKSSRYRKVAADIAAKVVDKQYQVGDRIYARSSIASQYAVSPETARRAIALLSDMGVVEATKGSGVVIKSYENARSFLRQSMEIDTLIELKRTAINQILVLTQAAEKLKGTTERLVDHTDQFRSINPFVPYEAIVSEKSRCAGKTISELRFWQETGATVIAVRREGILMLSQGPDEVLTEGDTIYFIGEAESQSQVNAMISKEDTGS